MKTLIKSITGEQAEIFAMTNERRLLARCNTCIEVLEHWQRIGTGGRVKTHRSATVHCKVIETTGNVDVNFLRGVSCFGFAGDFQHPDGVIERVTLYNLNPDLIDLCTGEWSFEVVGTVEKLLTF